MHTRPVRVVPSLLQAPKGPQFSYALYVTAVYVGYEYAGFENLDITMSIATVLGFTVALLLGFRTSASYDRWWEARKIWGGIVNDSRSLVRQLIGFTSGDEILPEVRRIAGYQIVAPTTWNFSPRDEGGTPGPVEAALVGAEVGADEDVPLTVQHIVRSFDPCMVCTVH